MKPRKRIVKPLLLLRSGVSPLGKVLDRMYPLQDVSFTGCILYRMYHFVTEYL